MLDNVTDLHHQGFESSPSWCLQSLLQGRMSVPRGSGSAVEMLCSLPSNPHASRPKAPGRFYRSFDVAAASMTSSHVSGRIAIDAGAQRIMKVEEGHNDTSRLSPVLVGRPRRRSLFITVLSLLCCSTISTSISLSVLHMRSSLSHPSLS